MKTIKDVFKKVDEMKKESNNFLENENSQLGEVGKKIYNQALEDVKPVIEKGIKEILEKAEQAKDIKKFIKEFLNT